jgi:plastocyanin
MKESPMPPLTPRTNPKRRLLVAVPIVAASLLVAACGSSGDGSGSGGQAASTTSVAPAGASVAVDTFMFMPKDLHIHVGDTVTWTNHDSILHTVTSGRRGYDPSDSGRVTATHKDGAFDMQLDGKGTTAQVTFTQAGTIHYFCDQHPGMEADVEVS